MKGTAMRYVTAIAITAALALTASAAAAGSKKHHGAGHARSPVAAPAPYLGFGPPYIFPRASVAPGTCIQDEGYGRWTYCGQGRS
jgi:hypothetical protein